MANQVLYRKYRPRTFSEIVGQSHVVTTLKNALATDEIAHAYLFTGPRGTGKTTVARILASALKTDPADLVEIDAASNRSIEDIRELREGIRVVPTLSPFRVFIIDEVHMLTKEAFNAFLKTLEEPPAHAIFILATTEAYKVPPTIISRCQRFDFHLVAKKDLLVRLRSLIKKEGRTVGEDVLDLVLAGSGGSVRDAESLLGNVLALGDKPDLSDVRALLGLPDMQGAEQLADFVLAGKKDEALVYLSALYQEGIDLPQFAKGVIRYMRDIMMGERGRPEDLEDKKIYGIIRKFMEAENDMKTSSLPHVPLELAVVEACDL